MEKSSHNSINLLQADDPRLSEFGLFSGLDHQELATLIKLTDAIHVAAGEKIMSCGDPGHCFYLIMSGSAVVTAKPPDGNVELARLKAGDFMGEISLVDDGPRSADVTALEDCTLLRITRVTIGVLAGLKPAAAVQILSALGSELVKRLRISNLKYIDLLHRTKGVVEI